MIIFSYQKRMLCRVSLTFQNCLNDRLFLTFITKFLTSNLKIIEKKPHPQPLTLSSLYLKYICTHKINHPSFWGEHTELPISFHPPCKHRLTEKLFFYPKLIFEPHASFETNRHTIKQRAGQYFIAFLAIREGELWTDAIFYFRFFFFI